jgi:hypothetical protein
MATMLRCTDPWGRTLVLEVARWDQHILVQHPELNGHVRHLGETLTSPHIVTFDARWQHGENFYRASALPAPYTRLYLKVCVRFDLDDPTSGHVITAYLTDRIKSSEERKWSIPTS